MPWLEFKADFDWHPNKRTTIAFKRGMRQFVTRDAARQAIAAGKADQIEKPEGMKAHVGR